MADRITIEDLLKAANEASAHVRAIWVTFLLFGTYLAIAVGATTHRDLLLQNRVMLPVLNVGLDLVTFYWVAPLLFVIFHLYVLVVHYVMAGKLHAFNRVLAEAPLWVGTRDDFRLRVHPYLVAQGISGPRRGLLPDTAMRITMWLTLVLAPIVLLLAFQIRFLPYHDEDLTWIHRSLLLGDLALIVALWPVVLHPDGHWGAVLGDLVRPFHRIYRRLRDRDLVEGRRHLRQVLRGPDRRAAFNRLWQLYTDLNRDAQNSLRSTRAFTYLVVVSVVVALFSVLVATVPGETMEREALRIATKPEEWWESILSAALPTTTVKGRDMLTLTAELFDGKIDPVTQRPATWLSRNLVVIGEDIVGSAKSVSFRGRDLRYAVLDGSRLADTDLTAARLNGASLIGTDLRNARLDCADKARAESCAVLADAVLIEVQLAGASLSAADLQNANLTRANLQQASLDRSNLRGAMLYGARLQGALLNFTQLQGASLEYAQMHGASLRGADARGAVLNFGHLHGVDLSGARLEGASLAGADLRGSMLRRTHLQGADLSAADLRGVDMRGAFLARADGSQAQETSADARLVDFETRPAPEALRELRETLEKSVKSRDDLDLRLRRLDRLSEAWTAEHERRMNEHWSALAGKAGQPGYFTELPEVLWPLACKGESARYAIKGIIPRLTGNDGVAGPPDFRPLLAKRLLDPLCEGVSGLSDADRTELRRTASQAE